MGDKNYRIRTNIANDTLLNVDMGQDFNFLEVLTLRLSQSDAYKLHSSNYGVIIGRVLANDAFGIPNAKVSVFIGKDDALEGEIEALYSYTDTMTMDKEGRRYNLLPDSSYDECYRVVGTFPNKRLMLDDNVMIEVYDKYYRYTTVTNASGDYMLFGVPSGSQMLHVDLDLSDIGILSQKPRDFEYKGYNVTMFDNPNQFKDSTALDGLAQIFTQDKGVFVYPFWGDSDNGIAAITRCDVSIQYKFEPTCVFMGSIVSDNDSNSIGHKCAPSVHNGMNDQLIAGEGTIEMIRKTTDGLVEEFQIQGNQLINSDGVWCYQIPMNLDYVGTDEYGNIVPTDNPSKGIPTRAQVRFRISKNESGDEGFSRHTAKYLVPMNPMFDLKETIPTINVDGSEIEKMYQFGSSTPQSCFRDLYWNNVYSVKNYIPKVQVAHRAYSSNYGALKGANLATDQNPIPFNKLKIDIPFPYMIVCILFTIVMKIIGIVNAIIRVIWGIIGIKIGFVKPFAWIGNFFKVECISLNAGMDDGNIAYFPGCGCPDSEACKRTSCPEEMGNSCEKKSDDIELEDKIQQNLALEYNIVKLDLYQDWINGALYMPLWYWRKRKKKTFLFGLFSSRAKNEFCDCDKTYNRLKTYVTCNLEYKDTDMTMGQISDKEEKWHKDRSGMVGFRHGLIKGVTNKDGLTVYYYVAAQPSSDNDNPKQSMGDRKAGFKAVRLYATDIILLGNLNENNLYGVPQLFKALPSTTSNVPAIAAIEESISDTDAINPGGNVADSKEETGNTITAGMDWGARGKRDKPKYRNGLFMDLSCTYAVTKAKSCINVERLSELGVNLDMSYYKSYSNGSNNIERGLIEADGFVTKLELDDEVNRAMFATMNHVGFVPQTYVDDNEGKWYDTQVEDDATRYLIPKMKYIYPVDFDGRMQTVMDMYKNGFNQAMIDDKDESYLTFRLGAEKKNDVMGSRHFYLNEKGLWSMPLYNNSFYFFFGINKGKTAIEKFKEMFDAQCFTNISVPFTLDTTSRGRSYCDEIYTDSSDAYAYIRVIVDDIQVPFSYALYDERQDLVIAEDGLNVTDFAIGGEVMNDDSGNTYVVAKNFVSYRNGDVVENQYKNGLTNQTYTLEVIDANFKTVRTRVDVDAKSLELDYAAYRLGTKFYDAKNTPISAISQDKLYGRIEVDGFSVDGYDFIISGVDTSISINMDANEVTITLYGKPKSDNDTAKFQNVQMYLTYKLMEDSMKFKDVTQINAITTEPNEYSGLTVIFEVDRPSRWSLVLTQVCDGKPVIDSILTESFMIVNGESFITMLNGMPLKFMIGDNGNSPFYNVDATVVNNPMHENLLGWYGVHQESSFLFNDPKLLPVNRNIEMWDEIVNVNYDMDTPSTKQSVLKFKFDALFSLSDGVYVTEGANSTLTYTSKGGVPPTLYHAFAPYYDSEDGTLDTYLFSDGNSITVNSDFPNIVGSNYKGADPNNGMPQFNPLYDNKELVGNYLASFTDDGDGVAMPPHADKTDKAKGEDEIVSPMTDRSSVYSSNSYLRGMFIDRRLDYNLTIFTPFQSKPTSLEEDDTMTWNYSRIMGVFYNGVEMSYDRWKNIISAETIVDSATTEATQVLPCNRLEYTYSYSNEGNGDAKTIYNDISNGCVWQTDDDETKQIVKRFYSAKFNGYDIRNYFWSTFNRQRLEEHIADTSINVSGYSTDPGASAAEKNPIYVVGGHGDSEMELFNGDFSIESVRMGGYPTMRYLDVVNKTGDDHVSLNVISCSYNVAIDASEEKITAQAEDGEEADLSFVYDNMVNFKPLNEDDKESINAYMNYDKNDKMFTVESCSLSFSYNARIEDGYKIYASVPTIVRVMPKTDGLDGITYLKFAENDEDFEDRKGRVQVAQFRKPERRLYGRMTNVILPSTIRIQSDGYLSQPTTHNEFENVTFVKSETRPYDSMPVKDVDVFSIEYETRYVSQNSNNLQRSLHTIEFSDMYDLRNVCMNISDDECVYVDDSGETTTDAGGQGEGYTHRLGFVIDVKKSDNRIFDNAESLSFSFRFRRKKGPFYLPASEVNYKYDKDPQSPTYGDLLEIHIIVDWTLDMNLGDDMMWRRNMMFIRTRDGFTYGLQFGLEFEYHVYNNPVPKMISGQKM